MDTSKNNTYVLTVEELNQFIDEKQVQEGSFCLIDTSIYTVHGSINMDGKPTRFTCSDGGVTSITVIPTKNMGTTAIQFCNPENNYMVNYYPKSTAKKLVNASPRVITDAKYTIQEILVSIDNRINTNKKEISRLTTINETLSSLRSDIILLQNVLYGTDKN